MALQKKGAYRILCLGESTTALGGVNSYPAQLEKILNQKNLGIQFAVVNKGIAAANTTEVVLKLEVQLDRYKPDMVITMMGINDRGVHMSYLLPAGSKAPAFLGSLRIIKLARLFWLHIIAGYQALGSVQAEEGWPRTSQINQSENIEASLKKAIARNKSDGGKYFELGVLYDSQDRFIEAEDMFKKAVERNPNDEQSYLKLGRAYTVQGKYAQAEETLLRIVKLNPNSSTAYYCLGTLYMTETKNVKAIKMLKKSIAIRPSADTYLALARAYGPGGPAGAEKMFEKAIEMMPGDDDLHVEAGIFHLNQNKFKEAEALLKKAMMLNPGSDRAYTNLSTIYHNAGKNDLAQELGRRANILRFEDPVIGRNYLELKKILDKRKIKYVCAQYPTRSLKPLKKIFEGQENLIFVDNEKTFKDAIQKENYAEYFIDSFAGDFGHCTAKGNRLLAENVANVIARAVFGK